MVVSFRIAWSRSRSIDWSPVEPSRFRRWRVEPASYGSGPPHWLRHPVEHHCALDVAERNPCRLAQLPAFLDFTLHIFNVSKHVFAGGDQRFDSARHVLNTSFGHQGFDSLWGNLYDIHFHFLDPR